MNDSIIKAAHVLGDLIKNDPACAKLNEALEDYQRSEELADLINEYNVQQELLMSAADVDGSAREKITARTDELYEKITAHPVYAAYMTAKHDFDHLYNEVMGEIEFAVTGERPCTHDCSSCGGCH